MSVIGPPRTGANDFCGGLLLAGQTEVLRNGVAERAIGQRPVGHVAALKAALPLPAQHGSSYGPLGHLLSAGRGR